MGKFPVRPMRCRLSEFVYRQTLGMIRFLRAWVLSSGFTGVSQCIRTAVDGLDCNPAPRLPAEDSIFARRNSHQLLHADVGRFECASRLNPNYCVGRIHFEDVKRSQRSETLHPRVDLET
jgi:hypothetical protein